LYRSRAFLNFRYDKKVKDDDYNNVSLFNFGPTEVHYLLGRTDRFNLDKPENIYAFTFLNKSIEFRNCISWHPPETTFLWRYNLHYFDYAYDLGVAYLSSKRGRIYSRFKAIVLDWIKNNPLGKTIGWDPYPTSLRIVNWIKAFHFFAKVLEEDQEFRRALLRSLYTQTIFLKDNIEYHLLNNHVIENAKALLMAGLFFNNRVAQTWRKKGEKILWKELKRQVADDGGHFELSPMYHTAVMLSYLEAVTALRSRNFSVPGWVNHSIKRMVKYLSGLCHPDGEIAFLNDSALGMTSPTQNVLEASRLYGYDLREEQSRNSVQFTPFSKTGYYVVNDNGHQSFFVFDCGMLGPNFQPGHGHCDTLSYEWSYGGERVVVDSGVDDYYRQDKWRSYYRSTRAHNTIMIDGKEQSEIWGNFRVGKRAYVFPVRWVKNNHLVFIQGEHDGYRNLPGRVGHKRSAALVDGLFLVIFDEIMGSGRHLVESFVHFHPQFIMTQKTEAKIRLCGAKAKFTIFPFGADISIRTCRGEKDDLQGWYAPEFGKRFACTVVSLSMTKDLPLRFGYCILPDLGDQGEVASQRSDRGYTLIVQLDKKKYIVKCSSSTIRMG